MPLDNIELLKTNLPPLNDDQYYFVQIMRRKKEHPSMSKSVRVVKEYFITKENSIDKFKNSIIGACNLNEARAYISVNRRSKEKSALKMISHLASLIESKQIEPNTIRNIYSTVSGRYKGEPDKKWIIDLDGDEVLFKDNIIRDINSLPPEEKGNKILFEVPTKNGLHLITTPFRLDKFKNLYPTLDIHKDNYTILYSF